MLKKSVKLKHFAAVMGVALAVTLPLASNAAQKDAVKSHGPELGAQLSIIQATEAAKPDAGQLAVMSPSRSIAIPLSLMKSDQFAAIGASRTIMLQNGLDDSQLAAISSSASMMIYAPQAMKPGKFAAMGASQLVLPKMQLSADGFDSVSSRLTVMPMGMIMLNSPDRAINGSRMSDKDAATEMPLKYRIK